MQAQDALQGRSGHQGCVAHAAGLEYCLSAGLPLLFLHRQYSLRSYSWCLELSKHREVGLVGRSTVQVRKIKAAARRSRYEHKKW